jgi:hypothetical protein
MKIILFLVALAIYGAYLQLGGEDPAPAPTEEPIAEKSSWRKATESAAIATAKATGLQMDPLPASGCSTSMLTQDQVADLVSSLPEGQRVALEFMTNSTSTVWSAQLYKSDDGIGVCFPDHGALLRLPSPSSLPDLPSTDGMVTSVKSYAESFRR